MKINAQLANYHRWVELRFFDDEHGKFLVAKPLELVEEDEFIYTEPTARLRQNEAQELMDSLWQCGLRPSEGSGSAGALAATQKHLEDMRTLVFETGKPK